MEYLYVVLSTTRWPALEEALARPAPPAPKASAVFTDQPLVNATRVVVGVASDEAPPPFERVIGGGREKLTLSAQTYDGTGAHLVVERRFQHVGP